MKEVTEKEMHDFINRQSEKGVDLILKVHGEYPYTTTWTPRFGHEVYAKEVGSYPENGVWPIVKKFYIIN